MFETFDPYTSEAIDALNERFATARDFYPHTLAVVSKRMWEQPQDRRATERALREMARDLARDGWAHPQDRSIRAGIRIGGDGTVWATLRHDGEHVTVLVAVEAESIRDGDPILEAVRRAAVCAAGAWIADRRAAASDRCARGVVRSSPMVRSGSRMMRAGNVIGSYPWYAEAASWRQGAARSRMEAASHRERLERARLTWQAAAQRQAERAAEGGAA